MRSRRGPSPWLLGGGTVAAVAIAAVVALWTLREDSASVEPEPAVTTSALVTTSANPESASTSVAPTTSAELTTTVAPTTSVASMTSVASTTSSVSTTTSAVTTTALPTSMVPATTSAAPAPALSPEDQIRELLGRYQAAYENLDVAALGSVYPSVPIAVKNSFQHFESLDLEMEAISGPEVNRSTAGRTATAVYRLVQTIEPKVGKRTVSRHQATFQFAGVGGAWIIVDVEWKPE